MKVKGTIISIQDAQTFDSGAKKLSFQIDTGETYNNILSFDLFKGAEHVQHVDNFTTYNTVGDNVEVEFNIQSKEFKGKWYTNLSMWKCEKIDSSKVDPNLAPETFVAEGDDGLPF